MKLHTDGSLNSRTNEASWRYKVASFLLLYIRFIIISIEIETQLDVTMAIRCLFAFAEA